MKADVACQWKPAAITVQTVRAKGNNDDLEWTDPSNMIARVALDVSECAWIYDYGNADDNCFYIPFPRNT